MLITAGPYILSCWFFAFLLLLSNVREYLQVNLCLTNQTDKTVGPFEVFLAPSMSGEDRAVLVNGPQKLVGSFTCMLFYAYRGIRLDLNSLEHNVGGAFQV